MLEEKTWTKMMQESFTHLGETDEVEAALRADVERAKKKMESTFKITAASAVGTVLEREAFAHESKKYKAAEDDWLEALRAHSALKNQRSTDVYTIDIWRSLNAARNKGQIV